LDELAPQSDWAVLAGSLPAGAPPTLYRELIVRLHRHHVKALIDGFGAPILQTLPAHPEIVKMNQHEFQETFDVQARDFKELIFSCNNQMQIHEMQNLVITCGKDGILAFTQDGVFHAGCSEIKEVNAAGAGDAVSAALSYRLSLGDSWCEALIWAAATSAAVVITEGTAEAHMKDIQSFYPLAWVKQIELI
jgi:fructose-1-phosphate kinase PfkB-like protein